MGDRGVTWRRWWRRQRNLYCRRYRRSSLLTMACIMGTLYLIYRYALDWSPRYTDFFVDPHHKNLPARNKMTDLDILKYKRSLTDRRNKQCMVKKYPGHLVNLRTSFLMYYRDKDFNLLKLALSTLLDFTPKEALYEIIIIDDGTVDPNVQRDEKLFLATKEFDGINIIKYRPMKKSNFAVSWAKAARKATGDILVFVDSDVIFNTGWYEPIIDFLIQRPDTVAVPRAEAMLSEARYIGFSGIFVNVFNWRLSILHYEAGENNDTGTVPTPVFRGDLFAMQRKLYDSLGGLDEAFIAGEGTELEFSVRTWLCGGEVHVVKCSQIAVHNVLSPREIELPITYDRIVKLWFDTYDSIVYKQTNQYSALAHEDIKAIEQRKRHIESSLGKTCKSFDWYLSNVAHMIKIPNSDWKEFGKIRDSTGYCLKLSPDPALIDLILCNPPLYQPQMIFEYTATEHLTVSDKCLMSQSENILIFAECKDTDNLNQRWMFYGDGLIISKAYGSCIEHVKVYSPDTDSMLHQAALRPCDDTVNTQKWSFIRH